MGVTRRAGGLMAAAVLTVAVVANWPGNVAAPGKADPVTIVDGTDIEFAAPVAAPSPTAAGSPSPDATPARRDMKTVNALAGKGPPDRMVLDAAMAGQPRVAAVAAPVETVMQAALARIPALAGGSDPIRVTCVATTCEATGAAAPSQSVATVEAALRDRALLQTMVEHGYTPGPATVADTGGKISFVLYLNNEM